jgi:hypothetical protein
VIGGRVLDTSAVRAFVEQRSVYASALVWTATEEDIVLVIPAAVLTEVRATVAPEHVAVLDVLVGLPVTVVEPLDDRGAGETAEVASRLPAAGLANAQAAACALARGWPLVSAGASRHADLPSLTVEEVP